MKTDLTQERLKALLYYNPETGVFRRRVRTSNRINVGDVAGCLRPNGYRQIRVDCKIYRSHRLAWLYVYGEWPDGGIDHINGVRDDNRIKNLRVAKTQAEQMQNLALHPRNTSGYPGACWDKSVGMWKAAISVNRDMRNLGYFDTAKQAGAAYRAAKKKHHKFCPEVRE